MTFSLGVVMDPIDKINFKKDTTLAMLLAAQSKGWTLHYMEASDLAIDNGHAMANTRRLVVKNDPDNWFQLDEPKDTRLDSLDVVLMRKDPPFNNDYIYCTYILELAETQGTLIVNRPQSLRDCNEKVFATLFPQCCPPLLVTGDQERLRQFLYQHEDVVYKPLDGMGGASIFRVQKNDQNLNVILETLTLHGSTPIMAQRYLPEILIGDKRVLMIDGEPVPYALARIPAQGEFRGNLAAGGSGVAQELSERDLWICKQIGPELKARGLIFVGLDIIGDYLTEINVTSPTCVRELNAAYNLDIGGQLMTCIEEKLNARP